MKHHLNLAKTKMSKGSGRWLVSDWDKGVSLVQGQKQSLWAGVVGKRILQEKAAELNHGGRKALDGIIGIPN